MAFPKGKRVLFEDEAPHLVPRSNVFCRTCNKEHMGTERGLPLKKWRVGDTVYEYVGSEGKTAYFASVKMFRVNIAKKCFDCMKPVNWSFDASSTADSSESKS